MALTGLLELNIEDNPELTGEVVDEIRRQLGRCRVTSSQLVYTVELNGSRYRRDLTELDISGTEEPFDLSGLHLIPGLESLRLSGDGLKSIYDLEGVDNLRVLDLSGNRISDLTPLAYMSKLESLNLANNEISNATALLNLTQLKELDLRGNKLTAEQIKRLTDTLTGCTILYD